MAVSDEIRRTLSDAKPLYALAGAGDLAAEKLRDAPILLSEMAGTVTTLATRLATEAPERLAKVQARIAEVPGALDPRGARESIRGAVGKADAQVLRERAQSIALSQVGRVLEAAGKAVETYDGLAERGRTVVDKYRGSNESKPSDVTVVVEQVVVDEPEAEESLSKQAQSAAAESKIEDAVLSEPADEPVAEPVKPKAAKKTTSSTPRKRATAPKTTPKSTNSDAGA